MFCLLSELSFSDGNLHKVVFFIIYKICWIIIRNKMEGVVFMYSVLVLILFLSGAMRRYLFFIV